MIAKFNNLKVSAAREGMKDSRRADTDHGFSERTTFVITPIYGIVAVLSSADDKVTPVEHIDGALETSQKLAGAKS